MYKPQVQKKHKNYAQLANYKRYSGKYLKGEGELFFLTKNNEPVAAAFVELINGRYRLSIAGVKDGSDEFLKMGVVGALRFFIMHYYYERGIDRLLIGVSMPIVFDGVTEFKMRLGAIPYLKDLEDRRKYYFVPVNTRPATARILKSNPLFHISGNGLNIAMFVSAEDYQTRDEFLKFFNRVKTRNVEKTRVYYFDNPGNIIQWLKEEDITGIEFNKYEIDRITCRIN